ncbi:MAG: hypothetical protein R3301_17555 [Saprospiraceae bacterium]|nr:hypothetical protein [Saprospiraceae bacterium]
MILRTIVGLFLIMSGCSGKQHPADNGQPVDHELPPLAIGIVNGVNRGTSYTDASGVEYNLRYIPVTLTNDSIVPVRVRIAFSKEYAYPGTIDPDKFHIIPLPREWALEGSGVTDSMKNALQDFIASPSMVTTIAPGDPLLFAIGTLYPRPPKTTGVLPRALFVHTDSTRFSTCDWHMQRDPSSAKLITGSQIPLGLRMVFGEDCAVIPCGHLSYLKG